VSAIVYRGTVEGVSSVDVVIDVKPAKDGEDPITRNGFDQLVVNIPGAANAEDVGDVQRAFGALIGLKGAVRITIEPVPDTCGPCEDGECAVHVR
jgi:hypothetical protein